MVDLIQFWLDRCQPPGGRRKGQAGALPCALAAGAVRGGLLHRRRGAAAHPGRRRRGARPVAGRRIPGRDGVDRTVRHAPVGPRELPARGALPPGSRPGHLGAPCRPGWGRPHRALCARTRLPPVHGPAPARAPEDLGARSGAPGPGHPSDPGAGAGRPGGAWMARPAEPAREPALRPLAAAGGALHRVPPGAGAARRGTGGLRVLPSMPGGVPHRGDRCAGGGRFAALPLLLDHRGPHPPTARTPRGPGRVALRMRPVPRGVPHPAGPGSGSRPGSAAYAPGTLLGRAAGLDPACIRGADPGDALAPRRPSWPPTWAGPTWPGA